MNKAIEDIVTKVYEGIKVVVTKMNKSSINALDVPVMEEE